MAKQVEPRRLRWSVPRADESTNRWLDAQYDISRSLQLLIRESIQRDGYIDVVNRPVEQLPRRGRPPQSGSEPEHVGSAADHIDGEIEPTADPELMREAVEIADIAPSAKASEPDEAAPAAQPPKPQPKRGIPSGLDAFLTQ